MGAVQLRVRCSLAGVYFSFLSFPSDRDSSTKSSVNEIGKNGVTFWFPGIKRSHIHQPSEKLPLQQDYNSKRSHQGDTLSPVMFTAALRRSS